MVGERRTAEESGIRFISFPIPDRGVPTSEPAAISLMTIVTHALDEGKNVAVHCRQGVGRSGLIAAGILATSGMRTDQAIEIVSAARGLAVPETTDQRLWLQGLQMKPAVVTH